MHYSGTITPAVACVLLIAGYIFVSEYLRMRRVGPRRVRRLPAVDVLETLPAYAAETGRPIFFTTGLTGISPLLAAALHVLRAMVRRCARIGGPYVVLQGDGSAVAAATEVVREATVGSRRHEQSLGGVRYLSDEQFAFVDFVTGTECQLLITDEFFHTFCS